MRIERYYYSNPNAISEKESIATSLPKGETGLVCAYNFPQTKISRRKILREIVFYTSLFYLKYLTPFSKIGWYFSPKMF